MEFVEGITLRRLLKKKGALDSEIAADLYAQLLRVLGHCHRERILHLDVKPENILVGLEGHISLLDYGLAMDMEDPQNRRKAGTPRYMAPEQLQGKPPYPSTDLYQLTLVFVECLTGRPVMSSRDGGARALEERSRPVQLPPKFSKSWRLVVTRATHPDPGERFSSAKEILLSMGMAEAGTALVPIPSMQIRNIKRLEKDSPGGLVASPKARLSLGFLAGFWGVGAFLGLIVPGSPSFRLAAAGLQILSMRLSRRALGGVLAFSWGLFLVWFLIDLLHLQTGGIFLFLLAVPVLLPGIAVMMGGVWLMDSFPVARLLRREVWEGLLLEVMAPGLGHQGQGRKHAPWVTGGLLAVALAMAPGWVGLWIGGGLFCLSLAGVFLIGLDRAREVEREEARILLDMADDSEEKRRCQAGLAILTGRLIRLHRRGEWFTPVQEKGSAPLAGKVLKALVAEIPEVAPCFLAGRVQVHVSRGSTHLLCLRHNLCPSPLPAHCDREMGTASGSRSTDGSMEEASTRLLDSSTDSPTDPSS
jgi:hypothetical protein